jgi:hypothetical protein
MSHLRGSAPFSGIFADQRVPTDGHEFPKAPFEPPLANISSWSIGQKIDHFNFAWARPDCETCAAQNLRRLTRLTPLALQPD